MLMFRNKYRFRELEQIKTMKNLKNQDLRKKSLILLGLLAAICMGCNDPNHHRMLNGDQKDNSEHHDHENHHNEHHDHDHHRLHDHQDHGHKHGEDRQKEQIFKHEKVPEHIIDKIHSEPVPHNLKHHCEHDKRFKHITPRVLQYEEIEHDHDNRRILVTSPSFHKMRIAIDYTSKQ